MISCLLQFFVKCSGLEVMLSNCSEARNKKARLSSNTSLNESPRAFQRGSSYKPPCKVKTYTRICTARVLWMSIILSHTSSHIFITWMLSHISIPLLFFSSLGSYDSAFDPIFKIIEPTAGNCNPYGHMGCSGQLSRDWYISLELNRKMLFMQGGFGKLESWNVQLHGIVKIGMILLKQWVACHQEANCLWL
jgi:hypothetical protein